MSWEDCSLTGLGWLVFKPLGVGGAQVPKERIPGAETFRKVHLGRERTQKQCTIKDGAKPYPDSVALPVVFPGYPWSRSFTSKPFTSWNMNSLQMK